MPDKNGSDMLLTAATLFLAAIFDRGNDPDVLAVYQWLSAEGVKNMEYVFSYSCIKEQRASVIPTSSLSLGKWL